jgi:hypothetical protein
MSIFTFFCLQSVIIYDRRKTRHMSCICEPSKGVDKDFFLWLQTISHTNTWFVQNQTTVGEISCDVSLCPHHCFCFEQATSAPTQLVAAAATAQPLVRMISDMMHASPISHIVYIVGPNLHRNTITRTNSNVVQIMQMRTPAHPFTGSAQLLAPETPMSSAPFINSLRLNALAE